MSARTVIREALSEEFDAIGRLTVEAYEALVGVDGLHEYRGELMDVASRAASGAVLVAVGADGEVLGAVGYVAGPRTPLSEFDDDDACGIRMLAVRPARQGDGTGRALVEACLARGRREGRRRVVLHSTPAMAVARGLYERLGFARCDVRDVVIAAEDIGAEEPLVLMAYERRL